ncbi:DUF881 domain-containing protein [Bacillus marinisedimentorum]|uniref:DUF881 domain-containing protein n=1 Tax=Bacillus marinisedimentorum TaxID=1821260 RepID=UPI000872F84E|nr:DUF881 domain-containing protein [Bacillus marinisedimentorum]
MRVTGKHAALTLVLLVTGFILSFSYQFTKEDTRPETAGNEQWKTETKIRSQLLEQEERNKELFEELLQKRKEAAAKEEQFANQENILGNLVEDVQKLRMLAGEIPVTGPGIEVVLADASYVPSEESANQYIVHESHIRKVVNELLSAGASAVAINGQRLTASSYIACVGPVVSVDGSKYPAPFVITAIGDPLVLDGALNIVQGVKDQLVNDNIEIRVEKKQNIIINAS